MRDAEAFASFWALATIANLTSVESVDFITFVACGDRKVNLQKLNYTGWTEGYVANRCVPCLIDHESYERWCQIVYNVGWSNAYSKVYTEDQCEQEIYSEVLQLDAGCDHCATSYTIEVICLQHLASFWIV